MAAGTFDGPALGGGGVVAPFSLAAAAPMPTPLPAAAWLMLGALGALGLASRVRGARA